MATYTVHEPPLKEGETSLDPARFAFVRDGFYFWAFLLAPLWMLRRQLWLVLLAYIVLIVALDLGLALIGVSTTVMVVVNALLAILVGLEAASLRRWTLRRRGWRNVGVVIGDNLETAERRFFDAWVKGEPHVLPPVHGSSARASVSGVPRPAAGTQVIGLFPSPGAPR